MVVAGFMSIHNPYKAKRSRFDDVVTNYTDDISTSRIRKDGKWEIVEDIVLDMENCWERIPTRNILLRIFKGSTSYKELMQHFKNGVQNQEISDAKTDGRAPKHVSTLFPFNDERQKFLKEMNELKILGFVEQSGNDIVSEDGINFTLTDEGLFFVKKKLVVMLEKQSFDVFMVLLSKENKKIFYSNMLMKIAERVKASFDQILLLVSDMESEDRQSGATGQELLREYIRYLKEIEEEDVKNYQVPVIYSEIVRKLAGLMRAGLVDSKEGMYFLTDAGSATSEAFTSPIIGMIEFLNEAGLIHVEKMNQGSNAGRYIISLKPEGLVMAREIKVKYENDVDRIIDEGSALDNFDLHETAAVIPIDVSMRKTRDREHKKRLSIYIIPRHKLSLTSRLQERANAIIGSMIIFFIMLMVLGLAIVPRSSSFGFGVIIVSVIGVMVFGCAYPASIEWIKTKQNKNEKMIIETQFRKKTGTKENIISKLVKIIKRRKLHV